MNRFSRKAMADWEELMSTPSVKEALKEYVATLDKVNENWEVLMKEVKANKNKKEKVRLGTKSVGDIVDIGYSTPDGTKERFLIVDKDFDIITLLSVNILDYSPFAIRSDVKGDIKANDYEHSYIKDKMANWSRSLPKKVKKKLAAAPTLPTAEQLNLDGNNECAWDYFIDNDSEKLIAKVGSYAATTGLAKCGDQEWYWTKSPSVSYANYARGGNSDGTRYYISAYIGSYGVRPALALRSDFLVK